MLNLGLRVEQCALWPARFACWSSIADVLKAFWIIHACPWSWTRSGKVRHERYNHIFRDPVRMTWYRQNQEESNKEIWNWSCTQITPKCPILGNIQTSTTCAIIWMLERVEMDTVAFWNVDWWVKQGCIFPWKYTPWGRNWGSTQRSRICEGSQIVLAHGGNYAELILKMTKRCFITKCVSAEEFANASRDPP